MSVGIKRSQSVARPELEDADDAEASSIRYEPPPPPPPPPQPPSPPPWMVLADRYQPRLVPPMAFVEMDEADLEGPGRVSMPATGPRTEEQAIDEAYQLLRGEPLEVEALDSTRVITEDPADANSRLDTMDLFGRSEEATAQLEANAALEKAALAELTPEEEAQYLAVQAALADDPVAQLALQVMLLDGRLPGADSLGGDPPQNLLEGLSALADPNTPLDPDLESERNALLADVVQEVAVPECINQKDRGTCTVTTVSIMLAQQNPAEYVRLITGLASPEGEVTLADGTTVITREEGTDVDDSTHRTFSQRLLAPALMELGNTTRDYDNATDTHTGGGSGLNVNGVDVVLEAVFGESFSSMRVPALDPTLEDRQEVFDKLVAELAGGESCAVHLKWGDGQHMVLVTGQVTIDGVNYVTYVNPWGKVERMSEEEFISRLVAVHYEPDLPPPMHPPGRPHEPI